MSPSKPFDLAPAARTVGHDARQAGSTRTARSGMQARRPLVRYITDVFFSTERPSASTPVRRCDAEGFNIVFQRLVDSLHQAEADLKACLTSLALPDTTDSDAIFAATLPTGETEAYIDQLALNEEHARLQEAWTDFAPAPAAHILSADSLAHEELLALQDETADIDAGLAALVPTRTTSDPALPLSQADLMLDNPVPVLVDYGMDAYGPIDGAAVRKGADALRTAYEVCRAETLAKGFDAAVDDGELAFEEAIATPPAGQEKTIRKSRRFGARVKTLLFAPRRWTRTIF